MQRGYEEYGLEAADFVRTTGRDLIELAGDNLDYIGTGALILSLMYLTSKARNSHESKTEINKRNNKLYQD